MSHKKFLNFTGLLFLFAFIAMIPACTQLNTSLSGEVNLQIDARAAETGDEPDTVDAPPVTATTKTLAVTISGDYQAAKTVEFSETAQVTFYRIPVGAKISLEAELFINDEKAYTGTSETFVVKRRKNNVQLVLKKVQSAEPEEPVEPEEPEEPEPVEPADPSILHVNATSGNNEADGITAPVATIAGALEKIKTLNDSTKDYTIIVTGLTNDYNLVIDTRLPANSITLKGSEQSSQNAHEHNGIARTSTGNANASVINVSGRTSLIITNFEFNVDNTGISGDGAVINVGNGSTVILDSGVIIAGNGGTSQGEQTQAANITSNGVVAVENNGTLIMKTGSTIRDFLIKKGAVYVKSGGTFMMLGGTITGITTSGRGGGVCLSASGNKISSFTMTGGTISQNTSDSSGRGISFEGTPNEGVTGKITLGGSALITSDNDIYLPDYMKIEVESELTEVVSAQTTPTITPESYTRTTPLFTDETLQNDELKEQVVKFDVTVDGDTGTTYVLAANGYMAKEEPQLIVNITFESTYQDINVTVTAGGQTITGSDPISGNQIITFTADEGYSAYRWTLDDTVISSTRQCSIDTSANSGFDWSVGTYDLKLEAYSKAGDNLFYSYNAQIEISAN